MRDHDRQQLISLWQSGIASYCPSDAQFDTWLDNHSLPTMTQAIVKVTKKYRKLDGTMVPDHLRRYTSSVANAITQQKQIQRKEQTQ